MKIHSHSAGYFFRNVSKPGSALVLLVLMANCSLGEEIDYEKQIKPVLQSRCYACHGVLKQEAGLRLDTVKSALAGGDSGTAIDPANVDGSLMIRRIASSDASTRMPPEGEPLKPAEIEAVKSWIRQGAAAPPNETPEKDPRDHWAFRAPVRPPVPKPLPATSLGNNPGGKNIPGPENSDPRDWTLNPIDAFIAVEHRRLGLTPQKPADRRIWIRRVSLDLVGLPPTHDETEAFLKDESPQAYERVVDRLLDSPHYGERWGRHWMDLWRYSDWWGLGAEVRNSQKHIWHWRDWIIESLNADKGYDQMLREMLAADELYPNDPGKLRATGFLARQYFKFNRTSWLDETIEHTSKAMLGLTLNCAKCHDHKYDPVSQQDYYRLRAIFEPYQIRTEAVPGELDFEKDGIPRAFDCNLETPTYVHIRGDDRNPDTSRVMEPAIPAILAFDQWQIRSVKLPPEAVQPGLRPFVEETLLKSAQQRISEAIAAVSQAKMKLQESLEAEEKAQALLAVTPPADALTALPRIQVVDHFTGERPDLWERKEGQWQYDGGRLKQSATGTTRATLRLKLKPSTDFEARLKFITTGGDQWKSVGILFDVTPEDNEILAYASAYAGGSKCQVSYKRAGNHAYPPEAAESRPVELNKLHELLIRVRGNLVNLSFDGKHSVAYRLPIPRQAGGLELITFDARAEFVEFQLSQLLENIDLIEPAGGPEKSTGQPLPLRVDQARVLVTIAERSLASAQIQPDSIRARLAADRARFLDPAPPSLAHLVSEAVRTERRALAAKAAEDVSRAELEVLQAAPGKDADAQKKLTIARAAAEKAGQAIEMPGDTYTAVTGALKTLESNLESEDSRRKPFPSTSSGRRTAFAQWLTDPRNPLPARVAVNHIWARHFGRPLVSSLFDFGRKGAVPSHPAMLDWMAAEFQESGWSMKRMHRLIVLSETYRLSSSNAQTVPETLKIDPENRWFWRMNPMRMQSQLVRDSLLSLSGELDLTSGGPSIPVGTDSRRRSLYFVHSHNEHQKFLSIFDDASVLECYRRSESIVPQQALALENSPLAMEAADKIARRLNLQNPGASDREFIRTAFLTILSAEPTDQEIALVSQSLEELTAAGRRKSRAQPELSARIAIIHVLLNHNDFVTIR